MNGCLLVSLQNTVYQTPRVKCTSFVRNVWVGHAETMYVHLEESEGDDGEKRQTVCLEFAIRRCETPPPDELLQRRRSDQRLCTVEFITKLLPDR